MKKLLKIKTQYILIMIIVFMATICYEWAFKKTIWLWLQNKQLHNQLTKNEDISFQPDYLERKNSNLDEIIKRYKCDTLTLRSTIINEISLLAEKNNVKLSEVPHQNVFYKTHNSIIQKLSFDGDYFPLLNLLNSLQNTNEIGIIRSVNLKIIKYRQGSDEIKKIRLETLIQFANK